MILPGEKIFFGVPSADRRIDVDCAISMFKMILKYGGEHYFHMGISDIALARNYVIHRFLKSDCDWLMMIDSDIIFSEKDWNLLWEEGVKCPSNPDEYSEDVVIGSYARKIPGATPTAFGLGFARVHRRVFEAIDKVTKQDGSPFVERYYLDGELYGHYFPVGVSGDSRWVGEDKGFFILCQMADIVYRLENRIHLQHVGFFLYGYPNQDNGAKFWTPSPPSNDVNEVDDSDDSDDSDEAGDERSIVVM